MKSRQILTAVLLASATVGGAAIKPEGQITFKVTDEYGKPLGGVPIRVDTLDHIKPGDGFGDFINKQTTVVSDKEGYAQIKEASQNPEFSYRVWDLPGYYRLGTTYVFKSNTSGFWQPKNPTVELVLRPVLNPVPMIAFGVDTSIKKPAQKYGFDLMAGDWVSPNGKGIAPDLIIEVTGYAKDVKDYDSFLTVSFSNPMDGIQSFEASKGSAFRSPREAPLEGYQEKVVLHRVRKPGQLSPQWIDDTQKPGNYFIRVRTVLDEKGHIKGALYGKIYGGFKFGGAIEDCYMRIEACYLNPESNSRNMEFDPKRNLFKGPDGNIDAP